MTTLADMTPQERAQCRGMWGEHTLWGLVIISITDGVKSRGVNVEVIRFIDGRPMREWANTSEVTPRPDLPPRLDTRRHTTSRGMGGSMSRWRVTKAYGVWYAYKYGWKHYKSFPAWAKDTSYADRKSRQSLGIEIKGPSGSKQDVDYAKLIENRLRETCKTHKN